MLVFPASCLFAFIFGVASSAVLKRTLPAMLTTLVATVALPLLLFSPRQYYVPPEVLRARGGSLPPEDSMRIDYYSPSGLASPPPNELVTYVYQPDDRFWSFQLIEVGIYLGLARSASVTAWWLRSKLR